MTPGKGSAGSGAPVRAGLHGCALALLGLLLFITGEVGDGSSATADEPIYIRSGLLILDHGDPSLNDISSPFLFKALNALPVAGLEGATAEARAYRPPEEAKIWSPLLSGWHGGAALVRNLGPQTVLPTARLVPRLTGVALGLLLYLFALHALGAPAALLSLAVYVLLPEVEAHASLATLESGLALTVFATLISWATFMKRPTPIRAILTGVCLGAALLTKTTGIVLAAYLVVSLAIRWIGTAEDRKKILAGFLITTLASWMVLNGAFSFQGTFQTLSDRPDYLELKERLESLPSPLSGPALWGAERLPLLLPASYVNTLVTQAKIAGKGKRIFFHGTSSESGWWWLMAVTFLIKMPVAFLLMIGAGFILWKGGKVPWIFPGFALFLLLFFTLTGRLSMGVRYLLPAMPCLALVAGSGLAVMLREGWLPKALAVALLSWLAVAVISSHPHQLSFTNLAVGGPQQSYRYLADSNVDWGQDLPALAALIEEEDLGRVRLSYFGSDDPAAYNINCELLPSVGLEPGPGERWWFEEGYEERFDLLPGVYAISANNLHGLFFRNPDLFKVFREREPDFRAGCSILLYHFGEPPPP